MIEAIKEKLKELSTTKTQNFSSRLIPNSLPIIGCRFPDLRKLSKEICKGDYQVFLKEYDASSFELELLYAYVISTAKMSIEDRISQLRKFVPAILDWAVCDGLISSLKCTKKYPKEMLKFILEYQNSHQEFEVRFLAEMLMTYYLTPEYVEQAVLIILTLDIEAYYAKMGVAWFIATLMINYKEKAFYLLKQIDDPITIGMAIRKIRDSYRISKEDKEEVLFYKK
ncbi:MAG: DNA alkylation repair protein [Roseburia sp.]|nr:DNA alkylation repair protein [Anaeroplasma bactoclasticum]MCM1196745.1 DNA alkylation repair protein [Roseburia sp.]MCM1557503.1 DNA alkylation repair protein [Anaeroplasma bactoclasticum]